jgi:hypothetical protein
VRVAAYLMEFFCSAGRNQRLVAEANKVAEAMLADGVAVRLLGAVAIPGEELCLCFFDAPSAETLSEVARRAALPRDCRPEPVEFVRAAW